MNWLAKGEGHPYPSLATYWPSGEAPTGQKGRAYPLPHYLPDFPTGWPKGRLYPPTGLPTYPFGAPYPHRLDGQRGGDWPVDGHWGGAGIFFRTYPHYPFGVGGRAFRPASLKHFSHTNRPVKPITEKAAIRGFLFIFGV